MTPDERGVIERTITALKNMSDDELLVVFLGGNLGNPNVDRFDPVVKAVIEGRLLSTIADGTHKLVS
jgi:hypothetical protein